MRRVMIDIEAWDRKETAIILSVGVVDIDTGDGHVFHTDLLEQERAGRTIGADTARWWATQSEAARILVFCDALWREPADASAKRLMGILEEAEEVWASGTSYDMKILSNFVAMFAPTYQWPFWKERDHRTMRQVFDEFGELKPQRMGVAHDALADARFQAEYLRRLLSKAGV